MSDNPKTDASSNTQKDPDDWVSGDEPMTGAQRSYPFQNRRINPRPTPRI